MPGLGLRSEIIGFGAIFGGAWRYGAPSLQRPFEWESDHVSDMVCDLLAAYEGDYRYYFLGNIVVIWGEDGIADIIDGQQRLTTFSIMMAYLRDRFAETRRDLSDALQDCLMAGVHVRLNVRESDRMFFRVHVQEPGGVSRLLDATMEPSIGPANTDPQVLMHQAARVIHAKLERLADDALAHFARFLMERALVDRIVAEDRSAASILFRGMNMRGKPLTQADLIKSEMIEHAKLPAALKDDAAGQWEQLEDRLGRDMFGQLLDMLPVLLSGETLRRPGDLLEWRARVMKQERLDVLLTETLPMLGACLVEILDGHIVNRMGAEVSADYDEINRLVRGLLLLEDRHWMAPAIVALTSFENKPDVLVRFFKGLDRLAFASFLGGIRHEARADRFARIIRVGADPRDLFSKEGPFALSANEQKEMVKRLREPFKRDSWRRRAIALRANAALPGGRAFLAYEDATVEHVAPQTFNVDWERAGWRRDEWRDTHQLLGNFAIVKKEQNALASGKAFPSKKRIYFDHGVAEIHALTADLKDYADWTPDIVRERTDMLIAALMKDWST